VTDQPSDGLAAFRQLLSGEGTPEGTSRWVELTDALVGPELGLVIRRCAVPHEFDLRLLEHIGGFAPAEAEKHFREFSELSSMQLNGDALSVHERWRRPLWHWWLGDEQHPEFVTLSQSLAEWFGALAGSSDIDERRQMFHLIGCRQEEGIRMFEYLCRRARMRHKFSECDLLIRLVNEYLPVLPARERAVISYHDGKLASDMRNWERAIELFDGVAKEPAAENDLQVNALVREGHALRMLDRTDEALRLLGEARDRSGDAASTKQAFRALYELGEIYRNLGQVDLADRTLRAALDRASTAGEDADVAGVLNSLGTVRYRLRDTKGAIELYNASLKELERRGDVMRPGSVLNNLAVAQMDKLDWAGAEASLSRSLEYQRSAGDQVGQANALLNLSRAQSGQNKLALATESAAQAGALYEAVGEDRGHGRAVLAQARLAKREKQAEIARRLFDRAIELAAAAGDDATAARARDERSRT
jgi:tetratricopeptide (TPR) repeat protein